MNIRKLSIFYETASCLNMSKVAKEMYISQPSISQCISEIEAELDTKLFDRIGKKLFLTYEGEIFFNYTRRILNIYEEGFNTIKDCANENRGKIIIGASITIGIYIMPYVIKKFNEEVPDIEISLVIDSQSNIEDLISHNKIDIAFIESSTLHSEVISKEICKDELVFISGIDHEWKGKKYLEKEDFLDNVFIFREDGSGTRETFETFLKSKNIEYKGYLELSHIEAIINYVKLNMGISCIPYISVIEKEKLGDLNISRLKDCKIERSLYIIIHKDKYISLPIKLFICFCEKFLDKELLEQINEEHNKY